MWLNCRKKLTDQKKFLNIEDYVEMLEAAIDNSEVGFLIADANCNVVKINEAQIKITGQDADYNLGKNMRDIQISDKSLSATVMISESKKQVKIEQHLPNGQSYLVYGNPFFDQDGNLKYIVSNLIDSTEVHKTKELLRSITQRNEMLCNKIQKLQSEKREDMKLVFQSKVMENLMMLCKKVAKFDTTVLVLGESGVGKELISEYIHENSGRDKKEFVKINCASIPENLLESELFGYEGGAFTGANKNGSKGLLETANKGTLMLDEIGELPMALQAKLLRFLQDGTFYRIGGRTALNSDVRIIAATNRNLEEMVENGAFRGDLFYRLSVVPIYVPALKERKEDIPLLISHFLKKFNKKYQCDKIFSAGVIHLIEKTELKGNVRELQNLVERLLVTSENNVIEPSDYANVYQDRCETVKTDISLKEIMMEYEKMVLSNYAQKFLTETQLSLALQTSQATISRKLNQYGIKISKNK